MLPSYCNETYISTLKNLSSPEEVARVITTSALAVNCRNPSEQTWRSWVGFAVWSTCDLDNIPDRPTMHNALVQFKAYFAQEKLRTPVVPGIPHYIVYPSRQVFDGLYPEAYLAGFGRNDGSTYGIPQGVSISSGKNLRLLQYITSGVCLRGCARPLRTSAAAFGGNPGVLQLHGGGNVGAAQQMGGGAESQMATQLLQGLVGLIAAMQPGAPAPPPPRALRRLPAPAPEEQAVARALPAPALALPAPALALPAPPLPANAAAAAAAEVASEATALPAGAAASTAAGTSAAPAAASPASAVQMMEAEMRAGKAAPLTEHRTQTHRTTGKRALFESKQIH